MSASFDLTYPAPGGGELLFDLFQPSGSGPFPVVICIHGGGWISGEKEMMSEVAAGLASWGYVAVCPQYRLAPLHCYPAAVEDVRAFVRYLRLESAKLGLDPNAIAALGNSAGGYLATMLGVTDAQADGVSSRVQAVVDICGITDLTSPDEQHFPVSMGFLEQYMGCLYSESPERWAEASPVQYVDASSAPFLIVHGEMDDIVPISQSEKLAAALFTTGVDVEFHRISGEGHSFTFGGWQKIESLYEDFLARKLKHELPV